MASTPLWTRIPPHFLDLAQYGRVIDAYARRGGGFLLLHIKSLHPRSPDYRKIGQWYIVHGLNVIDMKSYVGKCLTRPPLGWANKVIWSKSNEKKDISDYRHANHFKPGMHEFGDEGSDSGVPQV